MTTSAQLRTDLQTIVVDELRIKLALSDKDIDNYCRTRFQQPYANLGHEDTATLIDEMEGWLRLKEAMG